MSYEFHEILERYTSESQIVYSPDTILFTDTGKVLEEVFEGFRTYTASNRGVGSKNISTAETSNNGVVFLSQKYSARTIEVRGRIERNLNQVLNQMNKFFSQDLIKFSFYDEKDYIFEGSFQISSVEEGTLTPEVKISINLFDPFKYSKDTYTLNSGSPFHIAGDYICDLNGGYRPIKINFEADMTNNVTFTVVSSNPQRNGKRIKLVKYAGVHSGYISFDEGGQLYIGGALSNSYLDISSDIYSFVLGEEDKIETNATRCSAEFKMKGV